MLANTSHHASMLWVLEPPHRNEDPVISFTSSNHSKCALGETFEIESVPAQRHGLVRWAKAHRSG
jgi:hypothetical protein